MKKIISLFLAGLYFFPTGAYTQTGRPANMPSQTTYSSRIPGGPSLYGVFEGKTPCLEISRELDIDVTAACTKRKWGLILYQDSITHQPTTYKLDGLGKKNEGSWHIVQGTDPKATVYRLDLNEPGSSLFLLKGDDNVLFMLDKNKNFLVGNASFSYTLNRVRIQDKF
jgi:hypothetical protein